MYGHETIEELKVETLERPRRLRLVGQNRGMHYERDESDTNAPFLRSAAIVSKFSCVAFEAVRSRLITMRWYTTAALSAILTKKSQSY
jgi:hypothetical protein